LNIYSESQAFIRDQESVYSLETRHLFLRSKACLASLLRDITVLFYYFASAGMQSIAICVRVCMPVCLSYMLSARISQKLLVQIS